MRKIFTIITILALAVVLGIEGWVHINSGTSPAPIPVQGRPDQRLRSLPMPEDSRASIPGIPSIPGLGELRPILGQSVTPLPLGSGLVLGAQEPPNPFGGLGGSPGVFMPFPQYPIEGRCTLKKPCKHPPVIPEPETWLLFLTGIILITGAVGLKNLRA